MANPLPVRKTTWKCHCGQSNPEFYRRCGWCDSRQNAIIERVMNDSILDEVNRAEPDPVRNDHPAVWELVMTDMQERDKLGARKYGMRLQPHNGRNALRDGYQEALDLVVYLRQAIYEQEGR